MMVSLTSCSELLILSSGAGAVVSQNAYSKAYNSLDMITTIQTDKDIKQHIFEKLKKNKE